MQHAVRPRALHASLSPASARISQLLCVTLRCPKLEMLAQLGQSLTRGAERAVSDQSRWATRPAAVGNFSMAP